MNNYFLAVRRGLPIFRTQINCSRHSSSFLLPLRGRAVHNSVYDKNPEEEEEDHHATPSVVPDHVIRPQSNQYWAPHPQTGVFGPATEQNLRTSAINTPEDSVLEQKTFFRPMEDLEKPPPQP